MNEYFLLITIGIAFLITVLASPIFIPILKRLKFGQSIREEGPKSHMKKTGTPTMGGIVIILSAVITALFMIHKVTGNIFTIHTGLILLVFIGYGLLGFIDDFIKVVLKRNLGLTSKQKLIGQIAIAVIFYLILRTQEISTALAIPGTSFELELGWLYPLLIIFMIVGTSNAVNLTDGLDGLVSGNAVIAFGAFGILAWSAVPQLEVAFFSIAIVGALLGFLMFNAHPAKVFMGDTGSLALGGALAAIAIILQLEILLVIIGGVFVMETLSVMIQVISFKTRGKRVFLMSPLHHHFELKGWSEWQVVMTFWIAGFILAILGLYLEVWL
ncbi:phospho-N-acetylmuramoyl-pentapeptide-transferase [Amphibacillus sp. MSJ-3]|uniref:phospho-N-acetylmuramoyl-pentapeptide- transferase n=1 Tax=Amphibacillus sp. MSJ-3 TaxID=2841505 RepID=UPI001C0EFFA4|nr:phospho-N-acetylmuramoyl-pentapeptide-transferase [Amphibacillus sp. MSJ-3]MBU5595397.1 phospho-N-acetylmuramoyl-pentapeptide-transferase [Amphibacillus sp. MSJ-3]